MKKVFVTLILFILLGLNISNVYAKYINVEKNYNKSFERIDNYRFKEICQRIVNTIKDNHMYLVIKNENKYSAYYYGCDRGGRLKCYITLNYKIKKYLLNASVNVVGEGDLSENEANDLTYQLLENLRRQIEY